MIMSGVINKYNIIFAFVFVLITWLLAPIISIFVILLLLAFVQQPKLLKHLYLVLISLSLGLVNYTKFPESDLYVYYTWFESFNQIAIINFTDVQQFDYLFYFVTSILSHIVNGYAPVFILFWTTMIYYVLYLAILNLSKELKLKNKTVIAVILFVSFIGYGFPMTSHIVRQYVGESFFLLTIAMAIKNNKSSYLFFLTTILMHMSFLIFFPLVLVLNKSNFNKRKTIKYLILLVSFSFFIGMQNIFMYLNIEYGSSDILNLLVLKAHLYAKEISTHISFRMISGLILILILVIIKVIKKYNYTDIDIKIFVVVIYYISVLLLFRNTELLLIRYFFIFYGFYVIALMYLFKTNNAFLYVALLILTLLSPVRFFAMLEYIEFIYIDNSYQIIFNTVFDFLEFDVWHK
jgi:hypothetical protein